MALQVWLPLNGNLNNQGLSDITIVNNGNVDLTQNGKIGKCGTFNGSNYLSGTLDGFDASKDYTLALWFMMTTITTTNARIIQIGETAGRTNYADAQAGISIDYNNSGTAGKFAIMQGGKYPYISQSFSANTWYHVAVTKISGLVKVYLNGNLIGQSSSIGSGTTNSNVYIGNISLGTRGITGKINDVRIYDHCLSAKEVKEISQGLVLHYKMDGGNLATKNLIVGSEEFSYVSCSTGITAERIENNTILKITATSGNGNWVRWKPLNETASNTQMSSVAAGTIITLSYDLFIESGSGIPTLFINSSYRSFTGNRNLTGHWQRVYTSYAYDGQTSSYSYFTPHTGVNGLIGTFLLKNFKIEVGANTQPVWTRNEDAAIVYDCSGYGNDGVIIGNPTVASGGGRYMSSYKASDSTSCIQTINLPNFIHDGYFSMSIWFKRITGEYSTKNWETLFGGPSGFEYSSKYSATNSPNLWAYSWGNKTVSTYTCDEWHHTVMVRTPDDCKFYLDGELKYTGTAGSIPSSASGHYFFGAWNTTGGQNYRGYLSDARIYSTALSEEDILDLYHTSASIDKNGNLHCFQLKED